VTSPLHILVAEDDPDDRLLTGEALSTCGVPVKVSFVVDGEELLDVLLGDHPLPHLVLLDLNMPRKDGREALAEIRRHPRTRELPVVVLTTSKARRDVATAYQLGANSYIIKPDTYAELAAAMRGFAHFWHEIASLP